MKDRVATGQRRPVMGVAGVGVQGARPDRRRAGRRSIGRILALVTLTATLGAARRASADPPRGGATTPDSPQDEARRRYTRGLQLVDEGAFDLALAEFRRAYDLAPSYRILYNIGKVSFALNDFAGSLKAYEGYLSGGDVPPQRQQEVKQEIERLQMRVARLRVTSNVEGAELAVDDAVVGKTPFREPLVVNAGRRKVTLTAVGRLPETRAFEAAGGDEVTLKFELRTASQPGEQPPPPPPPPPERSVPWALWGVTGALAAGTAVLGVLALDATHDFDDARTKPVPPSDVDASYKSLHSKAQALSITTDIVGAATLVSAGVALYFTLKPSPAAATGFAPTTLSVGLGRVSLGGAF